MTQDHQTQEITTLVIKIMGIMTQEQRAALIIAMENATAARSATRPAAAT